MMAAQHMLEPDPASIVGRHWWRPPPEMRKPVLAGTGSQSRGSTPATSSGYTNAGLAAIAGVPGHG